MTTTIELKLFATLSGRTPADAACYPIQADMTVRQLLEELGVPLTEAKLIFINSVQAGLDSRLQGGERIGIFPPVGGG